MTLISIHFLHHYPPLTSLLISHTPSSHIFPILAHFLLSHDISLYIFISPSLLSFLITNLSSHHCPPLILILSYFHIYPRFTSILHTYILNPTLRSTLCLWLTFCHLYPPIITILICHLDPPIFTILFYHLYPHLITIMLESPSPITSSLSPYHYFSHHYPSLFSGLLSWQSFCHLSPPFIIYHITILLFVINRLL